MVGRTNRLIASWPTNDDLPGEGWKSLKENYKKLSASLDDIQKHADTEVRLIEQSIEQLGILMALRRAPEPVGSDKRNKRPRGSSPAGTPAPTPQGRGVSITLPPRDRTGSVGPSKKGRVPLAAGRKVALWNSKVNTGGSSEEDWILAIIIKVVGTEKGKFIYEVRDAEEQDNSHSPEVCDPIAGSQGSLCARLYRWLDRPGVVSRYELLLPCRGGCNAEADAGCLRGETTNV